MNASGREIKPQDTFSSPICLNFQVNLMNFDASQLSVLQFCQASNEVTLLSHIIILIPYLLTVLSIKKFKQTQLSITTIYFKELNRRHVGFLIIKKFAMKLIYHHQFDFIFYQNNWSILYHLKVGLPFI